MESKKTIEEIKAGDIIKRELTSRQSWTVEEIDGKLMAIPNTNKFFKDTEPVKIEGEYYVLANINIKW